MIDSVLLTILLGLVAALILPSVWRHYVRLHSRAELESQLPYSLFHLAAFPADMPLDARLASLSGTDSGPVGRLYARPVAWAKTGLPFREGLSRLSRQTDSPLVHRTLGVFAIVYSHGADASAALSQLAHDTLALQRLTQEHAAARSLQKYALLLSAALIVPSVLGMVVHTGSALQSDAPSLQQTSLSQALDIAVRGYLFVFSLLACAFAALSEGNLKKAPVYGIFIVPLGQLAFQFSQSGLP